MPRRRRGRGKKDSARSGQHYVERITFTVASGSTTNISLTSLHNPAGHAWRPGLLVVEAVGGYEPRPTNDQVPGAWRPAGIQVDLYNPDKALVNTTGPRMVGPMPKTLSIRYPATEDWWGERNPSSFASISGTCFGSSSDNRSVISGVVSVHVSLKPEAVNPKCVNHVGPSLDSYSRAEPTSPGASPGGVPLAVEWGRHAN